MKVAAQILVIEDDPDGRRSVVDAMQDAGHATVSAATAAEGLRQFEATQFDVVLSDIRLPDLDGVEVMQRLRERQSDVPVLLMTAYGSVESAVKALKAGAYDYILKPLDLADLQAKVERALETRRLRAQVSSLKEALGGRRIVSASPAMNRLLQQVQTVAATQATVLVTGESGVGKELVARALHDGSPRAKQPFVAVNCGAFAETLLESELFGHERGAFTGAVGRHVGAFERAQGGTLFLDEIGIAPPSVQVRLLRVIEEREIVRVGGGQPLAIDVRLLSATNRPLAELVREGSFRHDLLFRLQVVSLHVPPLRERRADIRPLADWYIAAACALHGRTIDRIEDGFYARLEQHAWPGNVRELKNVVEAAVVLAEHGRLTAGSLNLHGGRPPDARPAIPAALPLADIERQAIQAALERHAGNRQSAAAELGLSVRTIQRKIKILRLPF